MAPAGAHWRPHPASGPAIIGAPTVLVNGRPGLRVSGMGVHAACCGPNIRFAVQGGATVIIRRLPAHRLGGQDMRCGGLGFMMQGSPNVIVGG
jgi:uncharacterized Zn-binding protein involved in type VI secretion